MRKGIGVFVYNTDPDLPLDRVFDGIKNTHVVGEVSCRNALLDQIRNANLDIVAVNLNADDGLETVERIAQASPGAAAIGISDRTDPGTIIQAMRAGCTQFVPWPIDKADLQAAVDRISAGRCDVPAKSKTICVVGSAGGAGATTVACNLAVELADLVDRRCALVDLGLEFGDVACFFDSNPQYSVADLCGGGMEVDQAVLDRGFHELGNKVSILVRPERPEQAGGVCPEGIANMLDAAGESYPFVVADLPRTLSPHNAAALSRADLVLVVTQLGVPFIRNASRIYENFSRLVPSKDCIEIVLNRCESDSAGITPRHVEEHFRREAFGVIPNDYRRVKSCLDHGHVIATAAPRCAVRSAIRDMARKIMSDRPQGGGHAARPRLLSRLWKRKQPGSHAAVVRGPS